MKMYLLFHLNKDIQLMLMCVIGLVLGEIAV